MTNTKTALYTFILNYSSTWSMTQTFLKFKPLHPVDRGHSYPALWKPQAFPKPVFSHKIQYSELFMSLKMYRPRWALSFLPCAATTPLLVTGHSLVIAVHSVVWSCKFTKFQLKVIYMWTVLLYGHIGGTLSPMLVQCLSILWMHHLANTCTNWYWFGVYLNWNRWPHENGYFFVDLLQHG